MEFETLFNLALDRWLPPLYEAPPDRPIVGLGESGKKRTSDHSLGLPDWSFPRDPIPFEDESVGMFQAYHFMEHLTGEDAIKLLIEIERCLVVGGILQYAIPMFPAEISAADLTHKSFWTESSFRHLLENEYYCPTQHNWRLKRHYQVIAGVVSRNLCIMGQLIKV